MSNTHKGRTVAEIRARRARQAGMLFVAAAACIVLALRWLVRRTWRRALPLYWVAAELALVWLSGPLGIPAGTVGVAALAILITALVWPARSWTVRGWRAAIAGVLGGFALGTVAAGPHALATHPFVTVFLPLLSSMVLGWPWWHHLRHATAAPAEPDVGPHPMAPRVDPLTEHWAGRWDAEVAGVGVCADTRVIRAVEPRAGVTELLLQLIPGRGVTADAIVKKGSEVEVCLDLDASSVGFAPTVKASRVRCSLTHTSYVTNGVAWTGPTYRDGRCEIITYVDGSPGMWTFNPPGFGAKNGLVVGTTGSGKSRALGVLIANLLHAGWMVVVGDSQHGQSLPAWRDKTEYHAGPDAVNLVVRRFHAEAMRRSRLLADAGVEVFDENDPRVKKLGLKRMALVIDECQLIAIRGSKIVELLQECGETVRKLGMSLILATQLPQMASLGGSMRLRDALVGGNCLILRVSNRGSGSTILPDDFVGDPYNIKPEDEQGRPTAGMGYLRNTFKVGMIGRVPKLDETAAAAAAPRVEVVWQVGPVDPASPIIIGSAAAATRTAPATAAAAAPGGLVNKWAVKFGVGRGKTEAPAAPSNSTEWVIACLQAGPASAKALLDRPDCPVGSSQLYALLKTLAERGAIVRPAENNGAYTLPTVVSAGR
ncbi:ATP-binding protein [Krasilnikovia sp. MM14-A1259]|uniref:type IV secretory system conjugative DNA transfer family protein n=1 Tax=Krasilnikovia sp. MM14-A1259 TaxID=3373539 RepID=UPI00382A74CF